MTNGIVARMIAGAVSGAGFDVLFGYMVEGRIRSSVNLLDWFARDPATVAAFGIIGAIIGASLVYSRVRNKP